MSNSEASSLSPIRQEIEILLKNISLIGNKVREIGGRLDFVSIRSEVKSVSEPEMKPQGYGINAANCSQLEVILKKANHDLSEIENDLLAIQKSLQI